MKKTLMSLGLATSMTITAIPFNTYAANEIVLDKYEEGLLAQNVDPQVYTEENYKKMIVLIKEVLMALEIKLAEKGEISEKNKVLLKEISNFIQKSEALTNPVEKKLQYNKLISADYSISEMLLDKIDNDFWTDLKKFIRNIFIGKTFLPFADPEERDQKIEDTSLEAFNLVDNNGNIFTHPTELSGMSINEIANLDVTESDTMWYSKKTIAAIKSTGVSLWQNLENLIEKEIEDEIKKPYQIEEARRVLFFDKVKTSATSPKVDTKDAFGVKWKVKWGEEIQTETIANRLYVALGGKFTDLVYANTKGEQDLILVLDGKDNSAVENFKSSLLNSKYKFNVNPYLLSVGKITEKNADKILANVPKKKKDEYMGNMYVSFKESSVSLEVLSFKKNKNVELGAADLNTKSAQINRVKRALSLFTYWIRNKDAKEDNAKVTLINGSLVEYYHDLGASMGGLIKSGDVNKLKGEFLFQNGEDEVFYKMRTLYRPRAFRNATMADQLWMANKIISLKLEEINEAMNATAWPSFQKKLFLTKIISRRNNIQEIYQIGEKMKTPLQTDISSRKIITYGYNLKSDEDKLELIRSFNLAMAFDNNEEAALNKMNELITKNRLSNRDYTDPVYTISRGKAKLLSCKESITVNMIETYVHPSGLSARIHRGSDDKERPLCKMIQHGR